MSGIRRRQVLQLGLAAPLVSLVPSVLALQSSPLIYLSPIQTSGKLSRCQAEVWYVSEGEDMYVVTDASAWRAKAVAQGLNTAQIWVGDVGLWQRSNGRYLQLPSLVASAETVSAADVHARMLTLFGRKYADEWGSWGPRFKQGLEDGSRVMLKYSPQTL